MQTIKESKCLRAALSSEREKGRRIVLVPTMGHLHEGHLQLVRRAHEIGDIVVASLFVNPMQFGANEDFDTYPRTESEDQEMLKSENVHYLFMPEIGEMYPNGTKQHTKVELTELGSVLCGASRPVFFQGVCTVVCKLLNLVGPDAAVFGEKDFQQLTIIRRMASDLCMPIDIVGVPTARTEDGLALSSRNSYLTDAERDTAPLLYATLQAARDRILQDNGTLNLQSLIDDAREELAGKGFDVDYIEIRHKSGLELAKDGDKPEELVIIAAAMLGKTRLIDNLQVVSGGQ